MLLATSVVLAQATTLLVLTKPSRPMAFNQDPPKSSSATSSSTSSSSATCRVCEVVVAEGDSNCAADSAFLSELESVVGDPDSTYINLRTDSVCEENGISNPCNVCGTNQLWGGVSTCEAIHAATLPDGFAGIRVNYDAATKGNGECSEPPPPLPPSAPAPAAPSSTAGALINGYSIQLLKVI